MRQRLLRRNSVLFPYVRVAQFYVPREGFDVDLANSVLAYFAAGDWLIMRCLVS